MADKKRRAPLPPLYETQTREIHVPSREFKNPSYVEADESQQGRQGPLPLPDYETLFPQKRHGVKGNTGWDHLIAEVNQKQRDAPPELMGPEMSVDDPEVHQPRLRPSPQLETPVVMHYQMHSRDSKPVSTKKAAAPTPPKPASSAYPSADYQSQGRAEQSLVRSNPSPVPGQINSDTSSRESLPGISRDGARQALQPPPRPISQTDSDRAPAADRRADPAPTARPRQKVAAKEPSQQEPSAIKAALSDTSTSGADKKERVTYDPFPSAGLLPADPWAQTKPNQEADDLFTRSAAKEQRAQDRGMSVEDLDKIFDQDKPTDPFTGFSRNNSLRRSENGIKDEVSQMFSAAFQRKNSQKRRQNSPSMTDKPPKAQPESAHKDEPAGGKNLANGNTQHLHGGDDPFGAQPFAVPSDLTSSEPPQVSLEDPAQQAVLLSAGKPPLRAWVSPSEVQPVSAQNNNGGGLRRPHPVKPLSSAESQNIFGNPAIKDMKLPERFKMTDTVGSGPYTQLTQDELITLVVKQQADLSKRDAKIMELEEYIDNLLVRVIDEKPSILNALNAASSNVSSA